MNDRLNKATVLVLNRNWQAINIRTPQEAFCQMATGVATALEIEVANAAEPGSSELRAPRSEFRASALRPVTWAEWLTLPIREQDQAVHTVRGAIRVPTVIVLASFAKVPRKRPKLCARAIRERDGNPSVRCSGIGSAIFSSLASGCEAVSARTLAFLFCGMVYSKQMGIGPDLETALERLYITFAGCRLRIHVEGCPCCVAEPEKRALESAPLRQLTAETLGRYAFKAMTTWGDKDNFKHFLPRIFELAVGPDGSDWEIEVILGKLALAEWSGWDQSEQKAVQDFLRAEWNDLLADGRPRIEPDSWLCGMARASSAAETRRS